MAYQKSLHIEKVADWTSKDAKMRGINQIEILPKESNKLFSSLLKMDASSRTDKSAIRFEGNNYV
jgi:hypothetical protein